LTIMRRSTLTVFREGFPQPPPLDTAVSSVLLHRVSEGAMPSLVRLHRPGAVVAFGPKDRHEPGFGRAVAAARSMGFGAIERLAGGRAAVFHEGTMAFSWVTHDPDPRPGIRRRFEEVADLMVEAFVSLGVDARVGEVAGEYCPGEHSVNARGRVKVMGVGQRLARSAAHVGGVIVVSGADRIRDVLVPVYDALGLAWEPSTVGALADEVPGLSSEDVEGAVLRSFAARSELEESRIPSDVVAEAEARAPRFEASVR
jgi:octanoyl-[GcvH]:protein N-octanoyltransferase